jgi:hypothetical protein
MEIRSPARPQIFMGGGWGGVVVLWLGFLFFVVGVFGFCGWGFCFLWSAFFLWLGFFRVFSGGKTLVSLWGKRLFFVLLGGDRSFV